MIFLKLLVSQEPNYYDVKPRKFKKYQEQKEEKGILRSIEEIKQRIKLAEIESIEDELEPPTNLNHEKIQRKLEENLSAARDLLTSSSNKNENFLKGGNASDDVDREIIESPPTSRIDFQMHGN